MVRLCISESNWICLIRSISAPDLPEDKVKTYHLGHLIRGSPRRTDFSTDKPDSKPTDPAWNKPNRAVPPAPRVHVDFTRLGVERVLAQAFGEGSDPVKAVTSVEDTQRILCFSLWRPLNTVKRDPLAICDARSVHPGELLKLSRIYPDGATGENVVVKATTQKDVPSSHKWYWMSNQTEKDMLVIKIYDSGNDNDGWERDPETGKVGCTPHCSFHIPGSDNEPVRESIENRVVVVLKI